MEFITINQLGERLKGKYLDLWQNSPGGLMYKLFYLEKNSINSPMRTHL